MGRSEGQMVSARDESLRSGEVARLAGVNIETLRYYERRGLLPQPPRRPSGYRMYPIATVERVRFIKRAQQLGFSLREIQQLLQLEEAAWASCEEVCAITERKIQEIAGKIRDLQKIRRALQSLLRQCPRVAPISKCPILASLKNAKP